MTDNEARDEVFTLVKNYWATEALAFMTNYYPDLGEDPAPVLPKIVWQATMAPNVPEMPREGPPWMRVSLSFVDGAQRTMAGTGGRRFDRAGVLTMQVHAELGHGMKLLDGLAGIARDAVEGKRTPGGVWFRNARVVTVGPDGRWERANAVADVLFDHIK